MSRGFTLIELLIVVVVAAILLGVGVPSFQNAVKNAALTSSTNNMVASLQLARSEALKSRAPVTVCASSNASDCENVSWAAGWIVFADDNGDATRQAGEAIVHVEDKMRGGVDVTLPASQPLQDALTYLPTGFADLGALAAAGIMLLCDDRQSNQFGRVIVISQTGRPVASTVKDRPDLGVTCE